MYVLVDVCSLRAVCIAFRFSRDQKLTKIETVWRPCTFKLQISFARIRKNKKKAQGVENIIQETA